MGSEQHANNKNYKDAQASTILNVKCASTLYSKALLTQPLLALKPNQAFYRGVNKIVSWSQATSLKSHNLI